MEMLTLPIDSDRLSGILDNIEKLHDDVCINMHNTNFPIDDVKKRCKATMTYIRNTNLLANDVALSFDECTYEEKASYLMLFMQDKMMFRNPLLKHTWERVLFTYNGDDYMEIETILSAWEIAQFIYNNEQFITEVFRFFISIPLVSINLFNDHFKDGANCVLGVDIDEVEHTDFNGININNAITLLYDDAIVYLITNNKTKIEPVFYNKYFFSNENPYLQSMIEKLPFFELLKYMFVGDVDEHLKAFEENLTKAFNDNEVINKTMTENVEEGV